MRPDGGRVVDRRAFLGTIAGGLLVTPLGAGAEQTPKVYRVGVLSGAALRSEITGAFEQGLRDLAWVTGRNLVIEYRSAEGHLDRLPGLAAELARLRVDLLVAVAAPETSAAKRATSAIPIVFMFHGDPVGTGDVQSLARPGGNITGLTQMHPESAPKQLELLKEAVPRCSRVGVLWNTEIASKTGDWRELKVAAQALGLVLDSWAVSRLADFDPRFAGIRRRRPDALLTLGDPLTVSARVSITQFALKERLPAMYTHRPFVEVGGLMSYGFDGADLARRAAGYVDRILKGAQPADLPVEQATKFELVINPKTAKTLGLTIPPSLLARADQVIE